MHRQRECLRIIDTETLHQSIVGDGFDGNAGGELVYALTVQAVHRLLERIGKPGASRAVGNALGRNPVPLVIPCHRVIRGDGTAGGYVGGRALKERLLQLEGCPVKAAGEVGTALEPADVDLRRATLVREHGVR